jgi:hypothetical protein
MTREGKGTAAAAGEAGNSLPIRWEDFEERLTKGGWFWLATVRPNGAPHVMPLFAVWSGSALYVASKAICEGDESGTGFAGRDRAREEPDEAPQSGRISTRRSTFRWMPHYPFSPYHRMRHNRGEGRRRRRCVRGVCEKEVW